MREPWVTPEQIILAADVTCEANDVHQLSGMLDQAQANVEAVMGEEARLGAAVADAGYWSDAEVPDRPPAHGSQAAYQARPGPLPPARGGDRTRLRADEGPAGRRPLQHARPRTLPRRVATRCRGAQPPQTAPGLCPPRRKHRKQRDYDPKPSLNGGNAGALRPRAWPGSSHAARHALFRNSLRSQRNSAKTQGTFATGLWCWAPTATSRAG